MTGLAKRIAVVCLVACQTPSSPATPDVVLAARRSQIEYIGQGCEFDDLAELVSIAGRGFDWFDRSSDPMIDHQTRCWAMEHLSSVGGEMPQLYIGAYDGRCAQRFDRPEVRAEVIVMLEDQETCATSRYPDWTIAQHAETVIGTCPIPGLQPYYEAHHLESGLVAVKRFTAWHLGPVASRLEDSIADGSADAFRRMLAALASPAAERAEIKSTILAGLRWLRRRGGLTYGRRCYSELKAAIANGDLGADLVAHLDDPDPEIRDAILLVLQMQPRPQSRECLQGLLSDPDDDVRYDARYALEVIDRGGEAEWIERNAH